MISYNRSAYEGSSRIALNEKILNHRWNILKGGEIFTREGIRYRKEVAIQGIAMVYYLDYE